MMDWGTLDGDDSSADRPAAHSSGARDEWGSLDCGTPRTRPAPDGGASSARRGTDDEWGLLDGSRRAADDSRGRPAGPTLTPEATGSLLEAGEILWVSTAPGRAELGSGQRLTLRTPQTELFGWRQARIIEPAKLTAELIEIPSVPLPARAGDDPALLYLPPIPGQRTDPGRAAPFPVGAGPDLHQLLEQRIAAAKEQYRRVADEAAARAEARVARVERQAHSVVEQERGRLGHHVAAARHEVDQLREQVARDRQALRRAESRGNSLRTLAVTLGGIAAALVLALLAMVVRTAQ